MQLQKILVVIDPYHSNSNLLERAAMLGSRYRATIELFLADYRGALAASYPFNEDELDSAIDGYLRGQRKWLQGLAAQLHEQGLEVRTHVVWQRPLYDAVLNRATEIHADLILKQAHHHSLLQRALFTNTDWHLMRETTLPIWFVKDRTWGTHVRLLAAVDPMHANDKPAELDQTIVNYAIELAVTLPAALYLIHVYEVMPSGIIAEFDGLLDDNRLVHDEVKRRHRKALDELVATSLPPGAKVCLEEGMPERAITRYTVDEAIDLTVMGAVSRNVMDRIFIGSTAERVLDELDSDILVVR